MKRLTDFQALSGFFFQLPEYNPELLIWKKSSKDKTLANLKEIQKNLDEKSIMSLAEEKGKGEILWPLRVALSGQEASPGPLEIMDALGKKESLARIIIAIQKLS